jgi:hypothetical protein
MSNENIGFRKTGQGSSMGVRSGEKHGRPAITQTPPAETDEERRRREQAQQQQQGK